MQNQMLVIDFRWSGRVSVMIKMAKSISQTSWKRLRPVEIAEWLFPYNMPLILLTRLVSMTLNQLPKNQSRQVALSLQISLHQPRIKTSPNLDQRLLLRHLKQEMSMKCKGQWQSKYPLEQIIRYRNHPKFSEANHLTKQEQLGWVRQCSAHSKMPKLNQESPESSPARNLP